MTVQVNAVSRGRRGMTLIELLVVMAILGSLIALLLPSVQSARAAAHRTSCQNHLRQIGLAMHGHLAQQGTFPPGGIEWRPYGNTTNRQLAWCVWLLPYLDESPLYELLDTEQPFDSPANAAAAATLLPVFVCPTGTRGLRLVDGRGPCDYGGIYGERLMSANDPPKGSMLYDRALAAKHISDGLAKTLLVAEDTGFTDGQWINGRNLFDQAFPINAAPVWENDIRSQHAGGAQAVLADGGVIFLSEDLDLRVLAAYCTRAGHEVDFSTESL